MAEQPQPAQTQPSPDQNMTRPRVQPPQKVPNKVPRYQPPQRRQAPNSLRPFTNTVDVKLFLMTNEQSPNLFEPQTRVFVDSFTYHQAPEDFYTNNQFLTKLKRKAENLIHNSPTVSLLRQAGFKYRVDQPHISYFTNKAQAFRFDSRRFIATYLPPPITCAGAPRENRFVYNMHFNLRPLEGQQAGSLNRQEARFLGQIRKIRTLRANPITIFKAVTEAYSDLTQNQSEQVPQFTQPSTRRYNHFKRNSNFQ